MALACTWVAGVCAGQSDLDQVMGALAQRQHGHVTFTERNHLAMLKRPLESSGELFYDAPDRLEKRTLKPRPESLILERGVLSAQRGSRKVVLDPREYPQVMPFIESIRATLAGDRPALERIFSVAFEGSFDHWSLALVPLDPRLSGVVRQIRIDGARDAVQSIVIVDADGDRSVTTVGAEISP
jgi:hypothetical protein